jgi:hypothetical protein
MWSRVQSVWRDSSQLRVASGRTLRLLCWWMAGAAASGPRARFGCADALAVMAGSENSALPCGVVRLLQTISENGSAYLHVCAGTPTGIGGKVSENMLSAAGLL